MKYFSFLLAVIVLGQQNLNGMKLEYYDTVINDHLQEVQNHINKFDDIAKNAINGNNPILADRSAAIVSELVGVSGCLEYIRFSGTLVQNISHRDGPALLIKILDQQIFLISQHIRNLFKYSHENIISDLMETKIRMGEIFASIESIKPKLLKSLKTSDLTFEYPINKFYDAFDPLLESYISLTDLAINLNKDISLTNYSRDLSENLEGIKRSFSYIRLALSFNKFMNHKSGRDKIVQYINKQEEFLTHYNNLLREHSDSRLAELINDITETVKYYFEGKPHVDDWSISIAINDYYPDWDINDNDSYNTRTEEINDLGSKGNKLNFLYLKISGEEWSISKRFQKIAKLNKELDRLVKGLYSNYESDKINQPRIDLLRKINKPRVKIFLKSRSGLDKVKKEVDVLMDNNRNKIHERSIIRNKELASNSNNVNLYTKSSATWKSSNTYWQWPLERVGKTEKTSRYSGPGLYTSDVSLFPNDPKKKEVIGLSINLKKSKNVVISKAHLNVWLYLSPVHKKTKVEVVFNDNIFEFLSDPTLMGRGAFYGLSDYFQRKGKGSEGTNIKRFIDLLLNDSDDTVVFYIRKISDNEERIWTIETNNFREEYLLNPDCHWAEDEIEKPPDPPAPPVAKKVVPPPTVYPKPFEFTNTLDQHTYIFGTVLINGKSIEKEDFIGAFNGDVCVGSRRWGDRLEGFGVHTSGRYFNGVPVMGNDGNKLTAGGIEKPIMEGYMKPGDTPTFKIFDSSEGIYYDAIPSAVYPWKIYGIHWVSLKTIDNN